MPRIVRGGLIQATATDEGTAPMDTIKQAMIEKRLKLIEYPALDTNSGAPPLHATHRTSALLANA